MTYVQCLFECCFSISLILKLCDKAVVQVIFIVAVQCAA